MRVWSLGLKIPWERAWQLIPVFLPGESHEQRSLADYSPESHRVGHNQNDLAGYVQILSFVSLLKWYEVLMQSNWSDVWSIYVICRRNKWIILSSPFHSLILLEITMSFFYFWTTVSTSFLWLDNVVTL